MKAVGRVQWWNNTFFQVVRWVAFIPLGLVFLTIVEYVLFYILNWVLTWSWGWNLITFVLLPELAIVLAYFGLAIAYWAAVGIAYIAPSVKIGVSIFGFLYLFSQATRIWQWYFDDYWGYYYGEYLWMFRTLFIAITLVVLVGLMAAYYAPSNHRISS